MRKSVVLALVATLALTVGATAVAKPKKPPFKTGQYSGTVTSAISGKEPASHTVRLTISKIGKRYKLQLTSFIVKVTCNNKPRTQGQLFGVIYVNKSTGKFSGKTVRGHSPGTATSLARPRARRSPPRGTTPFPTAPAGATGTSTRRTPRRRRELAQALAALVGHGRAVGQQQVPEVELVASRARPSRMLRRSASRSPKHTSGMNSSRSFSLRTVSAIASASSEGMCSAPSSGHSSVTW